MARSVVLAISVLSWWAPSEFTMTARAQGGTPAPAVVEERHPSTHPMHYFVSLPTGWTRDTPWPVVIVITDADRAFAATARRFADARGSSPFIVVVPLVLSGGPTAQAHMTDFDYSQDTWALVGRVGNCRFDEDGLSAIIADVHERYNGDTRVLLTGLEAGGHVVLSQLFNHPERVRGVAAVAPNFLMRCVTADGPPAGASSTIPVRGFHGSADSMYVSTSQPWLRQQWAKADSLARARGFSNVTDTLIPGAGHDAMPREVLAFFSSLRSER
jgi:poly(3-hydroxybutyrate) depolymerase